MAEPRRVRTQAERDADGTALPVEVRKIGYPVQVRMVDGIPQCPHCGDPMVERVSGWMCPLGSALLDKLSAAAAQLDNWLTTEEPA